MKLKNILAGVAAATLAAAPVAIQAADSVAAPVSRSASVKSDKSNLEGGAGIGIFVGIAIVALAVVALASDDDNDDETGVVSP